MLTDGMLFCFCFFGNLNLSFCPRIWSILGLYSISKIKRKPHLHVSEALRFSALLYLWSHRIPNSLSFSSDMRFNGHYSSVWTRLPSPFRLRPQTQFSHLFLRGTFSCWCWIAFIHFRACYVTPSDCFSCLQFYVCFPALEGFISNSSLTDSKLLEGKQPWFSWPPV